MPEIKHKDADTIREENRVKALQQENGDLKAKLEYVAIMTGVDIDTDEQEAQNV
ncbi:MAG: hypothetical protein II903_10120 [Spirochaetales bacterium]|nr:hypothetical protein [Spirochaetales bacterium]